MAVLIGPTRKTSPTRNVRAFGEFGAFRGATSNPGCWRFGAQRVVPLYVGAQARHNVVSIDEAFASRGAPAIPSATACSHPRAFAGSAADRYRMSARGVLTALVGAICRPRFV